jgi:hypothetical protein
MPGNGPSAPAAIVGGDEIAADPDPGEAEDAEPEDAEPWDAEGADAEPDAAETEDRDDVVATAPDPALGVHAPASRASRSASAAIAAGRVRRRTVNAALLRLVLTGGAFRRW